MDTNVTALIATAVISLFLGLVAYRRAPDRPSNRLFALNSACVSLWAVATCCIQVTDDLALIDLLLRLVHVISVVVLATLVDFIWVFPDRFRFGPWRPRVVLYASALVVSIVVSSPHLVRSVRLTPAGPPDIEFGWPLAVLGLYMAPLLLYGNWVLWRKSRTLHGVGRVQTSYVLAGALVCVAIIFVTNIILPMITGSTAYSRWGVVACLIYCFSISVAIAKHRLWDLGGMARRTAAAVLAVASLTAAAAVLLVLALGPVARAVPDPLGQDLVWLVAGVMLGFALAPAYSGFRGLLSRTMQEERERIVRLLTALGEAMVHARHDGPTLLPILRQAQAFFGAVLVEAYVLGTDGLYRSAGAVHADDRPGTVRTDGLNRPLEDDVVSALQADHLSAPVDTGQLTRFGDVEEALSKLRAMAALQAEVVVPMCWREETIGLLVVGPKTSRDMYTASDLDLLRSCAAHAAIATRNAELRAQIIAEKERTEKVLAQMESGVIAIDSSGIIQLVNPAACSLLGRTEAELLNQPVTALPDALARLLGDTLRTGRAMSRHRVSLDENGELPVACSALVLNDPEGKREGAGIVFRDLRTEDALRRAQHEAERLSFIRAISAGMAHEIRNPLVAIRTFAELAPTRFDDPEFRESFFQVAQSEVGRLEQLVLQFMTLARPASTVREPVHVRELIASAVKAVSANAQSHDIQIEVSVPEECPDLEGDSSRLYQALANLLLNALEATPPGGRVAVRVAVTRQPAREPGEAVIEVWNSGSYISPEERERIFEPFYTSKTSGTGLGLAICHTIVDEHHGKVTVESTEEGGTTFVLRLPVPACTEAALTTS